MTEILETDSRWYVPEERGKNYFRRPVELQKRFLNTKACTAADFINKWGMVAGTADGEDSSGRSKLRLLTEAELVARAIKTTELLFADFEQLGWIEDCPHPTLFDGDY